MSINACEQMATGVSDITSIALVTLEVIHNALLIDELRLRFACRELLGNLAARKHWLDNSLELHTEIFKLCLHDISRLLVFKALSSALSKGGSCTIYTTRILPHAVAQSLRTTGSRLAQLYGLPKTHKATKPILAIGFRGLFPL